jgi:hypothetical protein
LTSDKSSNKAVIGEIFGYIVTLAVTAGFLYLAFHGESFSNLWETIRHASLFWLAFACVLTLTAHYLRAIRWKILLTSIKKDCSTNTLFGSILLGYGINNVIPRLGEVSRAVTVGKLEGVSRSSVLGTIVVERVIDVCFFGIACIISAFLYTGDLYNKFPWLRDTIYLGVIFIAVIIVILILSIRYKEKFYNIIVKIVEKFSVKFAHRIAKIFENLTYGFSSLKGAKNYLSVLFLSVLIILNYATTTYVGLYMLGMNFIKDTNFAMAFIIISISSIGVMIPTPGAIGSYHTITKSVLVSLFGFSSSISIAYATLTHATSYILHTLFAIVYFFIFKRKFTTIRKDLLKLDENE